MTIGRKSLALGLAAFLAVAAIAAAREKVLYEGKSPFTAIVVTEDDRGFRTLLFERGGDRQSVVKIGDPDHLELAYTRAMPVGLAFVGEPKRVLVVGLGGGSIPTFLRKHYPEMTIDVVDIDPKVVEVAKKYFDFREDAAMRAHVDDGRRFIEKCREPYDMIFLDAYGSDNIPRHLATREFLQSVRRALSPKGVVVSNIWNRGLNPLRDSMVRTYADVFEEVDILSIRNSGNEIVFALPRKTGMSRDALARRAKSISKEKGFRFDMGDLVNYGFKRMGKKNKRGEVLTDK